VRITPWLAAWDKLLTQPEPNLPTDDVMLFEAVGAKEKLLVVPGNARNIKITTAQDLALAEFYLGLKT
jgi:2-C-methyl-D-erythritol 4-phosphate cytidylyltransferase